MKIDDQLLDKLAKLARIKIPEKEKIKMKESLSDILTWMEKLQEIDTSGVEPVSGILKEKNHTRKDEIIPGLDRKKILQNAPDNDEKFIKVPLVKKSK